MKVPEGFCDRPHALQRMQVNDSTIERMVRDGRLKSTVIPRKGRKPERVYKIEDVERQAREREARRAIRPPTAVAPRPPAMQAELITTAVAMMAQMLKRFEQPLPALPAPAPPITIQEKLWLTLDEAVELSGLCRSDLLGLCQAHVLIARKSPGWKIQRKSLEAFEG